MNTAAPSHAESIVPRLERWAIRSGVFLAISVALFATYGERWPFVLPNVLAANAEIAAARLGGPAPSFSLPSVPSPGTARLPDFSGHPILLNFWATWCGPCRTEMPEFQRFQEQTASAATVIGIDLQEDEGSVEAFLRKYGISYRIVLDEDGRVGARYGVTGLPTTVFVDASGVLRDRVVGPLTFDGLVQRTRRLP